MSSELPDLFLFDDSTRVATAADWARRRRELLKAVLDIEYGALPPTPPATQAELLHSHEVRDSNQVRHSQFHVHTGPGLSFRFLLDLLTPAGTGPHPVVLTGDRCWRYLTDEVTGAVLKRGFALASFSRVEIAPDVPGAQRNSGIYRAYPGDYGALAAWAWGYQRCVDALLTMRELDAARIAVVGHSRGGKTVLLAGATDERIALTAPNDSGCGGAGCFRKEGPGSERLADILKAFPFWFSPRLLAYIGKEDALPFDQHAVKALVAPRALLTTEALGDLWANPSGTWLTHLAARDVYEFVGAKDRIGIWYREGGHNHSMADWTAFLDFAEWQFRGVVPATRYDAPPAPPR